MNKKELPKRWWLVTYLFGKFINQLTL